MRGFLITISILLMGIFALGAQYGPETMRLHTGLDGIMGPTNIVVGELARLEVEGEKVSWSCVPDIADGQEFGENHQKYVCSFRTEGEYTIVAAVYRNNDVEVLKFPIYVGEIKAPPLPDDIPQNTFNQELVMKAANWCKDTKANKSQCKLVASVFNKVANEIENGDLTSPEKIIERTAKLNQGIQISDLVGLIGKIQTYLTQEADAGRLISIESHLITWRSIAKGLMDYAKD